MARIIYYYLNIYDNIGLILLRRIETKSLNIKISVFVGICLRSIFKLNKARARKNQQYPQRRLRSAWALPCALRLGKDLRLLHVDSKDPDLSLGWSHRSFCWLCHAPDQLMKLHLREMQDDEWLTILLCWNLHTRMHFKLSIILHFELWQSFWLDL